MRKSANFIALTILLALSCSALARAQNCFHNPVMSSGADPWVIRHDGFYYLTFSLGDRIAIRKTRSLEALENAEERTVWIPPATGLYSKEIWAPELHSLRGRWYLCFSADDGRNCNHRLWVLENSSADPLAGNWTMRGQLKTPEDKWAIDGSLFELHGQLYLIWSGWEGDENGRQGRDAAGIVPPASKNSAGARMSSPISASRWPPGCGWQFLQEVNRWKVIYRLIQSMQVCPVRME
jgi:GH43 family beta-xylosidase